MVTFICPTCKQERTGKRRRCYQCTGVQQQTDEAKERIRQALKGVKHSDERRRKNSEAKKRHAAEGRVFDIGSFTRGKPSPKAAPPGTERVNKEKNRIEVKCEDGRWRYRARLVWAKANGPIPRGYIIHHRDVNPMNDDLENLQMVTNSEHRKIHAALTPPEKYREWQAMTVAARKQNGTY